MSVEDFEIKNTRDTDWGIVAEIYKQGIDRPSHIF
jgi:hypothetical protein